MPQGPDYIEIWVDIIAQLSLFLLEYHCFKLMALKQFAISFYWPPTVGTTAKLVSCYIL